MLLPKISIIMAVCNEQPVYLKKSINSILNQTHTNFEFIIINDASNNHISNILQNYKKKDSRILIINNKKNIGLTKSLNIGIKRARGQYIARMDSDDIAIPNRLNNQLSFLSVNHYDLVTSNYALIDINDKIISKKKITPPKNLIKTLLKGNIFVHSTFFGTRELFSMLYDEKFKRAQDYEFLLRIIGKNYRVKNLPKICLYYRMNENSISVKKAKEQEWFALRARLKILKTKKCPKKYYLFIIRSFFVLLLPYKFKIFLLNK